ncbi:MAG: MFS transporter [Pseudomonadota bacterium]
MEDAMLRVMWYSSPLLAGMFLLMLGNGLQSTLLGVRGGIEQFGNLAMGFVMSGYFLGFLAGAQITPWLLRRVGHVRVFAALASLISAAMILYAAIVHPLAWILMRVLIGCCMAGCYVVAESWLNDGTDNEHRGQVLSGYIIVQMLGIVLSQFLINVADPAGYDLFVIMAVAVSVAVLPILLSAAPVPVFETTRRMSLGQLFRASPLGCIGCVLLGGIFACLFGMSAVYASEVGLSTAEISLFVGIIYLGGMLLQYPIGWLSDRMDRRLLIMGTTALGTLACLAALFFAQSYLTLLGAAFLIGGMANPLYALLIAHTNDYLDHEDMASAAGGLIMLNGIGAVGTPILVGWLMDAAGPASFMTFLALLMGAISVYALYRSTVRPATPVDETLPIAPMSMAASPVAGFAAQDYIVEQAEAEARERAEEVAAEAPPPGTR